MTHKSRILTVSYGAFSCTLEGFDDSLGIMKAVAEHFRALTAEHPDFGTIPVHSDAQTAARFARADVSAPGEGDETGVTTGLDPQFDRDAGSDLGEGAPFRRTEPTRGTAPPPVSLTDKLMRLRTAEALQRAEGPQGGGHSSAPMPGFDDMEPEAQKPFLLTEGRGEDADEIETILRHLEAGDDGPPTDVDDASLAQKPQGKNAPHKHPRPEQPEQDVARLMEEADHQLQDPQASQRRSAFSTLRAAVAARFADQTVDAELEKGFEAPALYQNDLAQVIKHPPDGAPAQHRQDRKRQPLKLVPAQRIDRSSVNGDTPANPQATDASDMTEFARFAADHGATELPDLLEAGAAFMSDAQGSLAFSLSELLDVVRPASRTAFTSQQALRAFGRLLRAGKVEKQVRGGFTATRDNRYVTGDRAAG